MEKKLPKIYPTHYDLLIVQDLCAEFVILVQNSLSNLVNSLSERIGEIKCQYGHDEKKCKTCEIEYKYCNSFLEYTNFKDDLIEYKCLCSNNSDQ